MLAEPLRVELLDGWDAIDEHAWDQLLAGSATRSVFQTFAWNLAWWENFGRGKLLLVAAYADDRLLAMAPLFADQGMVFFVGAGSSDYLDFVGAAHRPEVLRAILDVARSQAPQFVGFRFHHLPDRSPTRHTLKAIATALELLCFEEGELIAPALRFADWPADQRLPTEKKSLLRHERALSRHGRLGVEHFSDFTCVEPLLPAFFQQHIERWSGTPFPSLFHDDQQRAFYYRFAELLGPRGWLRFSRVSLDGAAVAFHLGFLYRKKFLWYKPSFDIRMARQSPGEVLLRALLLQAQDEESEVFDFGLGDEPFKERFSTETNHGRTLGLYPSRCAAAIEEMPGE